MFNKTTFCLAFCSVQSSITPLSLAGLHSSPAVLHQIPLTCVTSVPIWNVWDNFSKLFSIFNIQYVTSVPIRSVWDKFSKLFSTSLGGPLAFNSVPSSHLIYCSTLSITSTPENTTDNCTQKWLLWIAGRSKCCQSYFCIVYLERQSDQWIVAGLSISFDLVSL